MKRTLSLFLVVATLFVAGCAQDIIYREDVASPREGWAGDEFVRISP